MAEVQLQVLAYRAKADFTEAMAQGIVVRRGLPRNPLADSDQRLLNQ